MYGYCYSLLPLLKRESQRRKRPLLLLPARPPYLGHTGGGYCGVPPFASLIHTDEGTSAGEEQAVLVPSVRMLHVATFQFSDAAETARYGTAMV